MFVSLTIDYHDTKCDERCYNIVEWGVVEKNPDKV